MSALPDNMTVEEKPLKKGQFTTENTVMEMKDYADPNFRMMMNSAADASLSGMKISGGMNNYVLEGMLQIANGHFLRGIVTMIKG